MTHHDRTSTYVLVAGAWLGGWAWDDVAARLRAKGHRVVTPTLLGLAERGEAERSDLGVADHVEQIAALLEEQDLRDVILVGHSYAGAVVTGAAALRPARVARLVYVDATVPRSDGPLLEGEAEVEAQMRAWAEQFDGRHLPLLPDAMLTSEELYGASDLSAAQLATFRRRATPMPLACMTTPLPPGTVDGVAAIPRTFLRCLRAGPAPWWCDPNQRRADDGYDEAYCGHWPMWSAPDWLVAALHSPRRTPASAIDRYESLWQRDERHMLEGMLDFHRDALVRKTWGLTDEQAAWAAVRSGTSLCGLLLHLARVEGGWFQRCARGIDPGPDAAGVAGSREAVAAVPLRTAVETYQAACERSRAAVADMGLDDLGAVPPAAPPTLRWIYLHMIEETARHAGHADIVRELIDTAIGE